MKLPQNPWKKRNGEDEFREIDATVTAQCRRLWWAITTEVTILSTVSAWSQERKCWKDENSAKNLVWTAQTWQGTVVCSIHGRGDWKRETIKIVGTDIARLVLVFEFMLTTRLCLMQGVLYELLIGFMFVVLFLSVLLIDTCGTLSWPALWSTFGRTIK